MSIEKHPVLGDNVSIFKYYRLSENIWNKNKIEEATVKRMGNILK